MKYASSKSVSILFSLLVLANLGYLIFPSIYYFGSDYSYELIENYSRDNLRILLVVNFLISMTVVLLSKININNNVIHLILILSILNAIIYLYQGGEYGLFPIIAIPFSYMALFYVFPQYKLNDKLLSTVLWIIVIWSIYPVVYIIIFPSDYISSLFMDTLGLKTFRGFAQHRNVYGFYAGIAIILLFVKYGNTRTFLKYILLLPLTVGLILSESRSSILATISVLLYRFIKTRGIKPSSIPIGVISMIAVFVSLQYYLATYSVRGFELVGYDRLSLWSQVIRQNSQYWVFGKGPGSNVVNTFHVDMTSHNFILQTLFDYGIFVSAFFFVLLVKVWQNAKKEYKYFLLYILIIGLFQPYFSYGVPIYFTLTTILIGLVAGSKTSNTKTKIGIY